MKNNALTASLLTGLAIFMAFLVFDHFAPGAMSDDSFAILSQARSGVYSDAHPPLLAIIWATVDQIIPGPLGMLLVNLTLFYGGLLLIFLRLAQRFGLFSAPLFIIVGLYPPVTAILGVIWIDITMAAIYIFALGLFIFLCLGENRKSVRCAIGKISVFILMLVGISSRHNGAAAALSIFIFFFYCSTFNRQGIWIHLGSSLTLGIFATILCFYSVRQTQSLLVEERVHLWRVGAIYDIAGVSFYEGKYLFNQSIMSGNRVDIENLYTPRSYIPLVVGEQIHALPGHLSKTGNKADLNLDYANLNQALFDNWISVIANYPGSYFRHRYEVFLSLTTRSSWGLWSTIYDWIPPNSMGIPEMRAKDSLYYKFVRKLTGTFVFVPVFYILLSLTMTGIALFYTVKKGSELFMLAMALYLSGLLHMVGLFFFTASGDNRYSHWMILTTVLATTVLVGELAMRFRLKIQSARSSIKELKH